MGLKVIKISNSWQDFVAQAAPLGKKQRGNAFELLTELFLQIDPIYRTKLKHVWPVSRLPPSIRHQLGVPDPEIGIDLVAQSTTGEYWAIQCKYHHDPSENLTLSELDPFINTTQVVCKGKFHTCLAVSCANDYSRNLKKHYPQFQYCLGDRFHSLDKDFFRQARALIRKQTPKLKKRRPRLHQKTAIKNAVKHFVTENEARGKLIHPCGTGKSLIGYWIADALQARTIIVALPSLFLVRQTLMEWAKESLAQGKDMEWMVVCSADEVADTSKGDPAMRFQEIGVDVTTKIKRIATFLRKRSKGCKVVFTTYQSGKVTAKATRKANRIFDLGIFDEAHRTVGQKDSLFGHLIHEKNIRIRKRVFMTATERRYRGSSETILSMENVEVYGRTFELMTFRNALEQKKPIISDYRVVTKFVVRTDIQQLIDENVLVKPDKGKWDHDTEARTLGALIALRKAMRKHRTSHALTFHNSIAKAKAFKRSQERFNDAVEGYGKVDCFHVSSETGLGERKAELEKFELSKKALITNAKCLSEGVDVPNIDAILFADPKRSTIDIVQAAGRALRPADSKKMAYIVVPVFVDEDDPEATDKAFQDILMTLRAMASNDDRIIDYFRSVNHGKRPSKSDSIIDFDVPESIKVKLDDFVEYIETQAWHRLARLSWMPFEQARAFVHSLNLKGKLEWQRYAKGEMADKPPKPKDIPSSPRSVYVDKGWLSWRDWVGTQSRPFKEARAFARSLNLKSQAEWQLYCKGEIADKPQIPADVPHYPHGVYADEGWRGMGDWLGTGTIATFNRQYLPFNQARSFVHALDLKSRAEWTSYCKGEMPDQPSLPENIPKAPESRYKGKGWQGWGDWLGTGLIAHQDRQYLPFERARTLVHALDLKSETDWTSYCKGEMPDKPPKPESIPATPNRIYADEGWRGMGDWLGTGLIAHQDRQYLPFERARTLVHALDLKSESDWRMYIKGERPDKPTLPENIPKAPAHHYANRGWISWGDWVGTGTVSSAKMEYRPFIEARKFSRSLRLKSKTKWFKYCKGELEGFDPKPVDIPANAARYYMKKGWISWPDWLGTKK